MWNYAGISECVVQIIVNIISVIICRALAGYRDKIGESVSVTIPCFSVSTVESYPFLLFGNSVDIVRVATETDFFNSRFFLSFFTLAVFSSQSDDCPCMQCILYCACNENILREHFSAVLERENCWRRKASIKSRRCCFCLYIAWHSILFSLLAVK